MDIEIESHVHVSVDDSADRVPSAEFILSCDSHTRHDELEDNLVLSKLYHVEAVNTLILLVFYEETRPLRHVCAVRIRPSAP